MRLPLHNICRAFPELDAFSDEQCAKFLAATLKRHWVMRLLINTLMVVLFFAGWLGLTLAVMYSLGPLLNVMWQIPVALSAVIIGAVIGGVSGLLIRDHWLRRRLAARILELACAGCGYSLLGLATTDGIIVCPECGNPCELAARGIEVDTALAPQTPESMGTP